jgi:hypothetical protein
MANTMFTIEFTSPYGGTRRQSFNTRQEAERMIRFYASCGTIARFV